MNIVKTLENYPILEVFSRNLYWKFSFIKKFVNKFLKKFLYPKINLKSSFSLNKLINILRLEGIKENDIVLIHSDMNELSKCGLSPIKIVKTIKNLLLPNGTIVCPTYPIFKNNYKGKYKESTLSKLYLHYDVKKSLPWTGLFGVILMKLPGSKRSLHPINTLTAYGESVHEIFNNENIDSLDLPCGINSTWANLVNLNAKIVCLGVDLAHSLTMVHVAEDCNESDWQIKNWYREKNFIIKTDEEERKVTLRERHPKWSRSYAEKKLNYDLFENKIAKKLKLGSLNISILESRDLIKFINGMKSKKNKTYPFYYCWISKLFN